MVIADVPTPIALPFAYFPMTQETNISGIIYPAIMIQITEVFFAKRRYYFALSDHYDLTILGDYYTNSYGMRFESYAKDMLIEVI
jgi:lipopolysaccharide assembly outer membrane protein LptD (OstA)